MTNRIAIWFHCLTHLGTPPKLLPNGLAIIFEQMNTIRESGLLDACAEMVVGCNGGPESESVAKRIIPEKARLIMHGLESRSENLTLVALHEWAKKHPGWIVFYHHAKGISHTPGTEYHHVASVWRRTMMKDLVTNWQTCVNDLRSGYDIACSCWEWGMADGTQNIPPGNFLWIKSDFVARLPSMFERARIKMSGISSVESRYESEVFWGNGPRPNVKEYRQYWRPWQLTRDVSQGIPITNL